MQGIGRVAVLAAGLIVAVPLGLSAPAAAQSSPGEYRQAIDTLFLDIRALWGEVDRFKVEARYCKPSPPPPSKAQAQAELAGLEKRVIDLNGRYNALKQSLLNFLDHNHRLYGEMMVNGRDPRDRQWWSRDDNNRQRMVDELARKKAALAAAPEVDCRPKPKPKPVATTGGFQPPALPVRPSAGQLVWPALPSRFCSYDEKIEYLKKVAALLDEAGAEAERAARFRTQVEEAVNHYVQNDRPVPADLIARRRQAIADVESADRRVREAQRNYDRANALPVIDCRQRPQRQDPPRTDPPGTAGPIQTGSALDDLGNRAYAVIKQMQSAYDRCDVATYERLLADLERLLEEARLARGAATGAGEFSNVRPEQADALVRTLRSLLEPRRWALVELKRRCREQSRSQGSQTTPSQTGFIPTDPRMRTILAEHDKVRDEVGVPRLRWDPALASGAAAYAAELARTGRRVHSTREGRAAVRESLNQGMLGWSPRQMVDNWLKEKRNFYPGTYPDVSRTGRWQDVSHYTQMIWPTTTHVGCGLTAGSGYQWLVCRYSPGGNKDGQPVGLPAPLAKLPVGGGMTQIDPPAPQTRSVIEEIEESDRAAEEQTRARERAGRAAAGNRTEQPPAPSPPPPARPTASDDAPAGDERRHPLVALADSAMAQFELAHRFCDSDLMLVALAELNYAIIEMEKRLRAARAAGRFSSVKPEDVQRNIDVTRERMRQLERRIRLCPQPGAPLPPRY